MSLIKRSKSSTTSTKTLPTTKNISAIKEVISSHYNLPSLYSLVMNPLLFDKRYRSRKGWIQNSIFKNYQTLVFKWFVCSLTARKKKIAKSLISKKQVRLLTFFLYKKSTLVLQFIRSLMILTSWFYSGQTLSHSDHQKLSVENPCRKLQFFFLKVFVQFFPSLTLSPRFKKGYFFFWQNFKHILIQLINTYSFNTNEVNLAQKPTLLSRVPYLQSFVSSKSIASHDIVFGKTSTLNYVGSALPTLRFYRYLDTENPSLDLDNDTKVTIEMQIVRYAKAFFTFPNSIKLNNYLFLTKHVWEVFLILQRAYSITLYLLPLGNRFTYCTKQDPRPIHNVIFKFNKHQFFISLMDFYQRRNYISLLPGLLIKHLVGRKKGAKKALTTKLLLVRFLRKILLVSRIKRLHMVIKSLPLHLPQLFNFLNKPLSHVIKDPFTKKSIDETGEEYTIFEYYAITFLHPKPYGYQKTRKKGRIKRKIRRKIVRLARVIDEA